MTRFIVPGAGLENERSEEQSLFRDFQAQSTEKAFAKNAENSITRHSNDRKNDQSDRLKFAARFWSKVDKNGPIARSELGPCWLWQGASRGNGYGAIKVDGKVIDTHRAAYELTRGAIPAGLFVCHRCDVRACVNPSHLFVGTHRDNFDDMVRKGRAVLTSGNAPPLVQGEKHGQAKLTESQAMEIIRRAHNGESHDELATEFDVNRSTITRIASGLRWRHLDQHRHICQLAGWGEVAS